MFLTVDTAPRLWVRTKFGDTALPPRTLTQHDAESHLNLHHDQPAEVEYFVGYTNTTPPTPQKSRSRLEKGWADVGCAISIGPVGFLSVCRSVGSFVQLWYCIEMAGHRPIIKLF